MKAIMISIKPKWCADIMNGKKTIEVRKNKALASAIQKLIDENGYADIYAYCSKDKWLLYKNKTENEWDILKVIKGRKLFSLFNGKVIFKFRCYKVEDIELVLYPKATDYDFDDYEYETPQLGATLLLSQSCLSRNELRNYLGNKGYALYITKLEIFDKPKELKEFSNCDKYPYTKYIGKAPQNFCYVEEN